jgi:(2Fe-2S) ferredoxin
MNADTLRAVQVSELERQGRLGDRILCCTVAGCVSSGAEAVIAAIEKQIDVQGKTGKTEVCGTGCLGLCSQGPLVRSSRANVVFTAVTPADAPALVSGDRSPFAKRTVAPDHPFVAGQKRIILANSGLADPERIADYIALGATSRCCARPPR